MTTETFRSTIPTRDGRTLRAWRTIETHADGAQAKAGGVDGELSKSEHAELMAWLGNPALPKPVWLL